MKKRIALIISVLALVVCAAALFSFTASADEDLKTVVYLRDGGAGDGSSYENAVGYLEDAYAMLDLSKDCTIVICDVFTQEWAFSYGTPYTGSVTFTSCYGGYDYRTIGAQYAYSPCRFVCWGETTFKNVTFHNNGTNILVIGQHNPVTVAEGVVMEGSSEMNGTSIAKSFCILGGYQNGQDEPPTESDKDTNVTVMSGSKIVIVPFSRSVDGVYTGTAHIKIGGNAQVGVLHGTCAYPNGIRLGKVEIELTDNASINNFYGTSKESNLESFTLNWKSGTINSFTWNNPYDAEANFVCSDKNLNASATVKAYENYSQIAGLFDKISNVNEDPAYSVPANPDTKTPTADMLVKGEENAATDDTTKADDTTKGDDVTRAPIPSRDDTTKAPSTTKAPTTTNASTSAEGGISPIVWIVIAAVVVAAVVVVIVVIAKKKGKAE